MWKQSRPPGAVYLFGLWLPINMAFLPSEVYSSVSFSGYFWLWHVLLHRSRNDQKGADDVLFITASFSCGISHRSPGWSWTSDPESTSQVRATPPGFHYNILPQNIQHGILTHQAHVQKLQEFSIPKCQFNPSAVNCLDTGWYMSSVSFKIIIAPTDFRDLTSISYFHCQ